MKKTIENTVDFHQLEYLTHLLEKGHSINQAIELLCNIKGYESFSYFRNELEKGEELQNLITNLYHDQFYKEMFTSLFPIKGVTYALKESIHIVKEIKKYKQMFIKKMLYPIALILIMTLFSVFVKAFLLPELTTLFESFNFNQSISFSYLFLYFIPNFLLLIVCIAWFIYTCLVYCITFSKHIHFCLKIPFIRDIIKTYYSFKFSFYLSKLVVCFDSFYDAISYFYKTNQNTDLRFILQNIYYQLEDGIDLQTIIKNNIYFTDDFKNFFYLLLTSHQQIELVDEYCTMTIKAFESSLKITINIVLSIIYLCTGIYVMSLYSLIIMPILEITTLL